MSYNMKQRLMGCLEALIGAMEAESALPDVIDSINLGIVCATPRVERLCPGYTHRILASEETLASMLLRACMGLAMFDFAKVLYKIDRLPDMALVRVAVDLIEEHKVGSKILNDAGNQEETRQLALW